MDPQLMANAMVEIIPKETGLFRNVVPKLAENMVRQLQRDAWESKIDLADFEAVSMSLEPADLGGVSMENGS